MTGMELIAHMRESVLSDPTIPYRWNDLELLRMLNYAEVQACRRGHLIIDDATQNDNGTAGTAGTMGQQPLCVLSVVANQAVYTLSRKILMIKRCQLKSMTVPLSGPVSYPEVDELMSGWRGTSGTVGTAGSGGNPWFFLNEPVNTITFVLAPSINDTAYLVVSRLPLTPFGLQGSPEIEEKHHEGLMNWAGHLAFLKNDVECFNPNLAAIYEQKFSAQFGSLPDANSERIRKTLSMQQRMRAREFGS